jgi:NADPH:quinone reductase-like Zn-dependent oxidoreductase
MKAIVYERYGQARLADVDRPAAGDSQLLVRVRAASVNPLDWHYLTGTPYFMRPSTGLRRPRDRRLGVDYAGIVEAVGPDVTGFVPGDEVFGSRTGAFAEYVSVSSTGVVVPKPDTISFEEAAAAPIAAVTALQGLRSVRPGHRVLIIGAGGGVGTYAVQIAAARGAIVTGVCSTSNVDLVRSLGAKQVIDYTVSSSLGTGFDLILDNVGTLPYPDRMRMLGPSGRLIGPKSGRVLGPLLSMMRITAAARIRHAPAEVLMTKMTAADLGAVADLLAAGTIASVVDRRLPLAQAPEALRYIGTGHARGKVVLTP